MNVPFSISDILERVVPGAVFLGGALYALDYWVLLTPEGDETPKFATFTAFALLSYVLGLIANILSSTVPGLDARSEDHTDFLKQRVLDSYSDFFEKNYDETAWKWCYGIVVKHGYAVNTEFFQGVYVFCSSVFVSLVSLIPLLSFSWAVNGEPFYPVVLVAASCIAFWKGSRKYSKLFAVSILEAFYSYRMDNHD